jgi:hypothetical protein
MNLIKNLDLQIRIYRSLIYNRIYDETFNDINHLICIKNEGTL